ncbi:hypothetical protein JTE90_004143, partial [Oedothorax gibbosus]
PQAHRTARDAVLLRNSVLSPDSRFQDTNFLKQKDNSFPRVLRRRPISVALNRLGPKGPIPWTGLGNINPFPLSVGQRDKHEHVFAFRQTSRFEGCSPTPFRTDCPHVQLFVHREPFFQFSVLKVLIEYLLLPPRICTGGGSRGAHARTFNAPTATLLLTGG